MSRIGYFDASLRDDIGHQSNACRHITRELRRRGIPVDIFASVQLDKSLADELQATPWFQLRPYEQSWAFGGIDRFLQAWSFDQDLRTAWIAGRYPFLYFNSVLAPQFSAIGKWLATFPYGQTPLVAIEFGAPSGASTAGWFRRFASQYRAAGRHFRALDSSRLLLFTFDAASSAEYSELLGHSVAVLPPVHTAAGPLRLRKRAEDGAITLGFLGQQRAEKGFNLLPEIVLGLHTAGCNARILIHDGDPAERPMTRQLTELAKQYPHVEFLRGPANPPRWQELLDRTDVIILPYEPNRYRASYSAVAVEAVGAGIPMVVPAGTTLESLANEYQGRATSFDVWTAGAVCDAILRAVASFEELSVAAFTGAGVWENRNGAKPFVDRLLAFAANQSLPVSHSIPPVSLFKRGTRNALLTARACGKRVMHFFLGADRDTP